jgi:hypothetical protein
MSTVKKQFEKETYGIEVYSIEDDGCLNGLWTNITNKGEVSNEIAKKTDGSKNSILGLYDVVHIECDNKMYNGKLKIEKYTDAANDKTFKVTWYFNNILNFEGIGFVIGKQFVVSYWNV